MFNSSPLIALASIGRFHPTASLAIEIVIPAGVRAEIEAGPPNDPARVAIAELPVATFQAVSEIPASIGAWDLGKGESEVLAWAAARREFQAVLDDRAARNCARSLGIRVCGTLGLILRAYRLGTLENPSGALDDLMRAGFRVDPRLADEFRVLVQESNTGCVPAEVA